MKRILIVEDQPGDLKIAAQVAASLERAQVEARSTAAGARIYLEEALEGQHPLPDMIILDLDLGYENGFELLRFWHANGRLRNTQVVVWTILAKEQQEMCRLFGVKSVVPKWEGAAALRRAIEPSAAVAQ